MMNMAYGHLGKSCRFKTHQLYLGMKEAAALRTEMSIVMVTIKRPLRQMDFWTSGLALLARITAETIINGQEKTI